MAGCSRWSLRGGKRMLRSAAGRRVQVGTGRGQVGVLHLLLRDLPIEQRHLLVEEREDLFARLDPSRRDDH
jgi:hypothetical protein